MPAVVGPTPFHSDNVTAPAMDAFVITPSNSTNENSMFKAIYVGVGGNIVVVTPSGNAITFVGVPQGSILPVMGVRVNSTSTTATTMVGLV